MEQIALLELGQSSQRIFLNNTIYAGNPAVFIRDLDENEFITRKDFFRSHKIAKDFDLLDQYSLGKNSLLGWIKSIL